eukprot:UN01522
MLQDLIPELAEAVFSYCTTVELKNLSRCCHSLKDLCRPTLWHTVQIPAAQLLDEAFASDPKLQYLLYTKVLRIFGMFSRKGEVIEKHMDIVLHNVQVVLKWCTPRILNTWFLPEGFATSLSAIPIWWKRCDD